MVTCGHDVPDNQETSNEAGFSNFVESATLTVDLERDDVVKSNGKEGKWTMVYDEGFEINFSNVKYFAFSKYQKKGKRDYDSLCGETLIGWYNNLETGERGCYRAAKVDAPVEASESLDMISVV